MNSSGRWTTWLLECFPTWIWRHRASTVCLFKCTFAREFFRDIICFESHVIRQVNYVLTYLLFHSFIRAFVKLFSLVFKRESSRHHDLHFVLNELSSVKKENRIFQFQSRDENIHRHFLHSSFKWPLPSIEEKEKHAMKMFVENVWEKGNNNNLLACARDVTGCWNES